MLAGRFRTFPRSFFSLKQYSNLKIIQHEISLKDLFLFSTPCKENLEAQTVIRFNLTLAIANLQRHLQTSAKLTQKYNDECGLLKQGQYYISQ